MGTCDLEVSQAQLHSQFSKILPFALRCSPASSTLWGLRKRWDKVAILYALYSSCAPQAEIWVGLGASKITFVFSSLLAVSPQVLGSCVKSQLA